VARRGEERIAHVNARLWLLTGCLLLGSCQQAPTGVDTLSQYLERLSGATALAPLPLPPSNTSLAPPKSMKIEIARVEQIDLIDFLSLAGCELQINLGRRNSQLGRSASPSQRLLLDLEFIRLAPACIGLLLEKKDVSLAEIIDRASAQRQQSLPLSIHQAVLAGPEWEAFWSAPTTLRDYPQQTDSRIVETLIQLERQIEAWLGGNWIASNRDFELLLSDLRAGDGGALLLSMDQVAKQLARANDLLTRADKERPLCPFGRKTTRSQAVEAVVKKFFVGAVQPWLVQLRQRKELLSSPIAALETPLVRVQPEQYRDWVQRRDALMESQAGLIKGHVRVIQQVLSQCGGS